MRDSAGLLHHVELYVSDLGRSREFWEWFLGELGWTVFQEWEAGVSLRKGPTYLVLVQVDEVRRAKGFHRKDVGLNHLAFHASSRAQVDSLREACRERGVPELYAERYPEAGGPGYHALFLEDPDRLKVELVASEGPDVDFEVHEGAPGPELAAEVEALRDRVLGEDPRPDRDLGHRLEGKRYVRLDLARDTEGTLVGFKVGYEERHRRFYSWLGGVHPERRGRGIGSALMRRQHEGLRAAGYASVRTHTLNRWRSMLRLNLSHGFEVVGVVASGAEGPKVVLTRNLQPLPG